MRFIPIAGLNALAWTLCSLDIVLTFGRLYIRRRKVRKLLWDDILNGVALVALIAFIATYQVYLPSEHNIELYGLGLSGSAPTKEQMIFSLKLNMANVVLFWIVIYLVKSSFLALYWTVFSVSSGFRKAWGLVATYTVISFCATFLALFWHCGHPKGVVDPVACHSITPQLVIDIISLWCTLNVVGDLLIIALPLGMLRSLKMARSEKVALGALFSIVIIDIVFDILRTVYTASSQLSQFQDANAVWTLCEPTIAVMVCALPSYRGLLARKKSPKFLVPYEGSDRQALHQKQAGREVTEMNDLSAYSLHSTPAEAGR